MISCCTNENQKKCIRKNDNKVFKLPRKFSKKKCINTPSKGFTMKASCAPYKYCKKKPITINHSAIAVLAHNNHNIKGIIKFVQTYEGLSINYNISGLSDGEHGFHIHQYGDLSDNCNSACAHFNPFNKKHGGLHSYNRHAGDLGNIISKNKKASGTILDKILSLDLKKKTCIIGRMIIIHQDRDDLGLGNNDESLITGNAGKRVACGVIGLTHN